MARTVLVPATTAMGHDWLSHFSAERTFIFDPALSHTHAPTHLTRWHQGALEGAEFFGSIRPIDDPIRFMESAVSLLGPMPDDATILFPPAPRRPLERQLMLAVCGFAKPDRVLTVEEHLHHPWPIGAEPCEIEATTPDIVIEATRRGHWLQCAQEGHIHRIELTREVRFRGGRFGSGRRLPPFTQWHENYLDKGSCDSLPDVKGLLVGLGRESGPDFGWAIAIGFKEEPLSLEVRSLVPPPLPVTVISLGRLRLDLSGKELETIAPWSV
ncbi:MAG: hypothetical protein KF812_08625 [Fimbriimonadaceae bacterium]|nr:hypothetical protein [Fimbriimonadaceae bacterium]